LELAEVVQMSNAGYAMPSIPVEPLRQVVAEYFAILFFYKPKIKFKIYLS
jgi:hypothetical protein